MDPRIGRRSFLGQMALAAGAVALAPLAGSAAAASAPAYRGPNVVLVRFGGGVRRRETIDPAHTHAPWFLRELAPRGTLYRGMELSHAEWVHTSHGEGTLNLLTGRYDRHEDVSGRFLGARFESAHPTLFELLRRRYDLAPHEALIVNHEDRTDEEFYSFSNHPDYGLAYRCEVLSLYRFKCHLLRRQIESGGLGDDALEAKRAGLAELESLDLRAASVRGQSPPIERFWDGWRAHYGESGLVNPRGDRLLTELAVRAVRELRPRLMLVNYNDPDYVHWGNPAHYTRAISIIDAGIRRLVETCASDPFYRDRTVFVIVPDCGRDSNPFMAVPFQHHFNSRSAREIFALVVGPGLERGRVVDRRVEQIAVTPTVAALMGAPARYAQAGPLREALAG